MAVAELSPHPGKPKAVGRFSAVEGSRIAWLYILPAACHAHHQLPPQFYQILCLHDYRSRSTFHLLTPVPGKVCPPFVGLANMSNPDQHPDRRGDMTSGVCSCSTYLTVANIVFHVVLVWHCLALNNKD